jgi:F0F1-type ATP synthase membrane subunit a
LISYVARAFSLGIRLFANMVAGHILVKIIGGWLWSALTFSPSVENKFIIVNRIITGPVHSKGFSHVSPFFVFLVGVLTLFFSSARFKNYYANHFSSHIDLITEQLITI